MSAREAIRWTSQRMSATLVGEAPAPSNVKTQPVAGTDPSIIFLDGILCTALRRPDRPPTLF